MAFVVGVVGVVGVVTLHSNHSDHYYDHSRYSEAPHSNYSRYGDAEIRRQQREQEGKVSAKEDEVVNLRRKMDDNYKEKISALKREKSYIALDKPVPYVIDSVKKEMFHEIENEIAEDNKKLAEIDKMIARINEIELQSRKE